MATDKGARSVEVNVSNMTIANFTIQSVQLASNASWIKAEEPVQGAPFNQYNSVRWGAMTDDFNSAAGGQVVLTGFGNPISIAFNNDEHGVSTCTATDNSEVTSVVHQVDTGEQNHSQFNVTLNQS